MIAGALMLLGAACTSPRETPRSERARIVRPSSAGAAPSSDAMLPSGPMVHGLSIPRGGEVTASNDLGDDYVVPFEVDAVVAHVRAQLDEPNFEPLVPAGGRFRRITPRGAPQDLKLYVLVMPFPGRGTLVRVQRLPEQPLTPEQLERNVRRFEAEQAAQD